MKGVVISVLVVLAMVQLMAEPARAITCDDVDRSLASCLPYLLAGGDPSNACCAGVKSLKDMTPGKADRQTACSCVKAAAIKYKNIKADAATALPDKCHVQMGIPISMSTNCNE